MKKSKYSDTQIVSILKEAEAGLPVKEICRKYGISSACYYNWKVEVRWFECLGAQAQSGTRSGEQQAQADVCGHGAGKHALKDLIEKKL